jgi:hypothetical protein
MQNIMELFEKIDELIIGELENFFQGVQIFTGKDNFFWAYLLLWINLIPFIYLLLNNLNIFIFCLSAAFIYEIFTDIIFIPKLKEKVYADLQKGHRNNFETSRKNLRITLLYISMIFALMVYYLGFGELSLNLILFINRLLYCICSYLISLTPFPENPNLLEAQKA